MGTNKRPRPAEGRDFANLKVEVRLRYTVNFRCQLKTTLREPSKGNWDIERDAASSHPRNTVHTFSERVEFARIADFLLIAVREAGCERDGRCPIAARSSFALGPELFQHTRTLFQQRLRFHTKCIQMFALHIQRADHAIAMAENRNDNLRTSTVERGHVT